MKKMWTAFVIVGLSSPLAAQRGAVERTPDPAAAAQAYEKVYEKMVGEVRARMAVEAKITTGAPYSAEAVTESTQALADGNRINRKSVTRVVCSAIVAVFLYSHDRETDRLSGSHS
jgi:hypothetical protein